MSRRPHANEEELSLLVDAISTLYLSVGSKLKAYETKASRVELLDGAKVADVLRELGHVLALMQLEDAQGQLEYVAPFLDALDTQAVSDGQVWPDVRTALLDFLVVMRFINEDYRKGISDEEIIVELEAGNPSRWLKLPERYIEEEEVELIRSFVESDEHYDGFVELLRNHNDSEDKG